MCSSERVLRFKFDCLGIREFRTVVRQDHREQPTKELVPQSVVKPFENIYDRLRSVGIPKICKHETAFDKMDRQEAFTALLSNYGIHLHDVSVRIFFQESMKVLIVPPQTAAFVHFELGLAAFGSETDTPRQIDVSHIKKPGINVVVDRFLAAHDLVTMRRIDLMDRLPLHGKWSDDTIQSGQFILIAADTAA
jgi:uncharacterized protein with GYD domain